VLAVGAPFVSRIGLGATCIFKRGSNGLYTQFGPVLIGSQAVRYPLQGTSVSLTPDGTVLVSSALVRVSVRVASLHPCAQCAT
jgi:hypothetical protein